MAMGAELDGAEPQMEDGSEVAAALLSSCREREERSVGRSVGRSGRVGAVDPSLSVTGEVCSIARTRAERVKERKKKRRRPEREGCPLATTSKPRDRPALLLWNCS